MLPLRARVELGAMALKGYSAFKDPKIQYYWNLTIRLLSVIFRTLVGSRGSYLSSEKQSVYSTAPTDWAKINLIIYLYLSLYVSLSAILFFMRFSLIISLSLSLSIYIYIYIYIQTDEFFLFLWNFSPDIRLYEFFIYIFYHLVFFHAVRIIE